MEIQTVIRSGSVTHACKGYDGLVDYYLLRIDMCDTPSAYQSQQEKWYKGLGKIPNAFVSSEKPPILTEADGRYNEFKKMMEIVQLRQLPSSYPFCGSKVTIVIDEECGRNGKIKLIMKEIRFSVDDLQRAEA
jgi:hypothetical protein